MIKIDKSRLQSHNPWWLRQELILEDDKIKEFRKQKYKFWHPFYFNFPLDRDAIFTLRGPRQVGKTTLLKLLIKKLLLEKKVHKEAVFFFPCDRISDYDQLYQLLLEYLNFARPRVEKRLFIFLDEISFVKDWQRAIKELKDAAKLKRTTLLLTGSNILDLKFSSERLPGRRGEVFRPDIEFLPLSFAEFIKIVKPDLTKFSPKEAFHFHFPEFQKYFEDFLLTGGFLNNINQFYQKKFIPSYVYEIYLNWIEGDLHKAGKSENSALKILERIFLHLTTPVSYYKIAKESGLASYITGEDYIDILEKMFVLISLNCFSCPEKKVDFKKNKKIYFVDPFILTALLAKQEGFLDEAFSFSKNFLKEEFRPKIAEMMVCSQLRRSFDQLFYGKIGEKEIDFVSRKRGEYFYFEVKYKDDLTSKDFHQIKEVMLKEKILIITKSLFEIERKSDLVPLEIFLAFPDKFL